MLALDQKAGVLEDSAEPASTPGSPSTGASGQPIQISWNVSNQSPHAIGTTDRSEWSDSVYLASDASHYVTGQVIAHDGGWDGVVA